MKKKIILIILILLVVIGIIAAYFIFKDEEKEITRISVMKEPSYETIYYNSVVLDTISYLSKNELSLKTNLKNIGVKSKYDKCSGTIIPNKNVYSLTSTCKDINSLSGRYNINYTFIKHDKLIEMDQITEVNNGYIYSGKSNDNTYIIGCLNLDGTTKWEHELLNAKSQYFVLDVFEFSDSYIIPYQNVVDKKAITNYLIIDKKGKIIKNEKMNYNKLGGIPVSDLKNYIVFSFDNNFIGFDSNLNEKFKIKASNFKASACDDKNIYYLDEKSKIHIVDIKTKKDKKFDLENNENVLALYVSNGKIMVISEKTVDIYDKNGELVFSTNYTQLDLPKEYQDYSNLEENSVMKINKVNNNIYINVGLSGFLLVDKYDVNFELTERNLYAGDYVDIKTKRPSDMLMIENGIVNIQYSEEYKIFVKAEYIMN